VSCPPPPFPLPLSLWVTAGRAAISHGREGSPQFSPAGSVQSVAIKSKLAPQLREHQTSQSLGVCRRCCVAGGGVHMCESPTLLETSFEGHAIGELVN